MAILFVIFFVVIGCFIYFTRKDVLVSLKGKAGELKVKNELSKLPEDYVVLKDIILRIENGTSQIDHVVVSKYAIFAIETKNYRGQIYGSDYKDEWLQTIVTNVRYPRKWWKVYRYVTKNTFYSPVKQARGHALAIQKFLDSQFILPIVPIVVFAGDADISTVKSTMSVIYVEDVLTEILKYKKVWLEQSQVEQIAEALKKGDLSRQVSTREYVQNIKRSIIEKGYKEIELRCPRCGSPLYQRSGKFGPFYGCSNYPRCRYTAPVKRELNE